MKAQMKRDKGGLPQIKKLFPKIDQFEYFCNNTIIKKEDIIDFVLSKKSANLTIELFCPKRKKTGNHGTMEINSVNLKLFASKISKWKHLLKVEPTKKENRLKIMQMACEFLRSATGKDNPSSHEKSALVIALKNLYPAYKELTDQQLLKTIVFKNKNDLKSIRKLRADAAKTKLMLATTSSEKVESIQNMIAFLKREHVVIYEEKFNRYLTATVDWRVEEMKQNPKLNIKLQYNFFTTRPEFILHDFKNRYKDSADNFYSNFESVLVAAAHLYERKTQRKLPDTEWPDEVESLMFLFHFLKTPSNQKKPAHSVKEMLDSIIFFQHVDGAEVKGQAAPFLIAVGLSPRHIDKYQIHLEYHTFDLPEDISFIRAMDYLMKSFFIFNVQFPKMLSEFYNFVMLHIYKLTDNDPVHNLQLKTTTAMDFKRELGELLEE